MQHRRAQHSRSQAVLRKQDVSAELHASKLSHFAVCNAPLTANSMTSLQSFHPIDAPLFVFAREKGRWKRRRAGVALYSRTRGCRRRPSDITMLMYAGILCKKDENLLVR